VSDQRFSYTDLNPYSSPTELPAAKSPIRIVQTGPVWVRMVRFGALAVLGFLAIALLTVTLRGGPAAIVLLLALLMVVSVGHTASLWKMLAALTLFGLLAGLIAFTVRLAVDILAIGAGIGVLLGVITTLALRTPRALQHSFAQMRAGRLHDAANECTRDREPTHPVALNNRGLAYLLLGDFQQTIADCTEAIRLKPKLAASFSTRGIAYLRTGRFAEALADANHAVRLQPRDAIVRNNRGLAHEAFAHYDEALADYHEANRLGRKFDTPLVGLARVWACCPNPALRDGQRALEAAQRAAHLNTGPEVNVSLALADAYAELGRFGEAIQAAQAALGIAPDKDRARVLRHLKCFEVNQAYRLSAVDYIADGRTQPA